MNRLSRMALVCGVLFCGHVAMAQTVYRCGDSYSETPCIGGRAIDASDPRSAEDKRRADAATRDNLATANRLERDRLLAEAASRPAVPPPRVQKVEATPVRTHVVQKKKKTAGRLPADYFTAAGPAAQKPPKGAKPPAQ
jgi:hypothetical protein